MRTAISPPTLSGGRGFGDVYVSWSWQEGAASCEVFVSFCGQLYVETALNRDRPLVPFSAYSPQGQFLFAGQIRWDAISPVLLLEFLRWNGGEVTDVWLGLDRTDGNCTNGNGTNGSGTNDGSPAPVEEPPAEVEVELDAGAEDLFPYLFLHPWPTVSAEDRKNRFVSYPPNGWTPPPLSLYETLAALYPDRLAMELAAVAFVEGQPPWEGQFAPSLAALGAPLDRFAPLAASLLREPDLTPTTFFSDVSNALGMSLPELALHLESGSFLAALDRAWQSLFSLMVVLGDQQRLLDGLIRTVVFASLLRRAVPLVPNDGSEIDAKVLRQGLRATVVLPVAIFPLPPANGSPPSGPSPAIPYAIGDLEIVRRRLKGYTLGEVSRIENVMQGERKQATRRNLERLSQATADAESSRDEQSSELAASQKNSNTTNLSWPYTEESTSLYGQPTEGEVTTTTTWGPSGSGADANLDSQAQEIAQTLTNTAVQRLARTVWHRRVTASLDEREETVVHRFDGTHADGNLRGVYRWVNKVYENWLVRTGRRLILEIFLPHPAGSYLAAEAALRGVVLEPPVPPQELGLTSFRDVSRDPASATYYLTLAARYGVTDVTPPPAESQRVTASFQSGGSLAVQMVPLPEGYAAAKAWVTSVLSGDGSTLTGLVGQATFPAAGGASFLILAGETGQIPAGVLAVSADPAGGTPPSWVLTIEIETLLRAGTFETWQMSTYRALTAGYQSQRASYFQATGAAPSAVETRNPPEVRATIRQSLRKDVIRRLLGLAWERLGPGSGVVLGEPRYLQFFDQAFEWNEMTYTFTIRPDDPPNPAVPLWAGVDNPLLTAFLEAGWARLLLPVRPADVMAVVYFLSSGMLWGGPGELTPTDENTLDLVNDLKQAGPERDKERLIGQPWTVEVPTSMTLLQDSPDLPGFPPMFPSMKEAP